MEKEIFKNTEGKRENAGYQHFLLLPQCFLHFQSQCTTSQPKSIVLGRSCSSKIRPVLFDTSPYPS